MADCGCGRSPTGQCIGWHNLPEEEYQQKLKEHQEKEAENNNDANPMNVQQSRRAVKNGVGIKIEHPA